MKNIYSKKSSIAGRGVFAGEDIRKGDFVTFMRGKKIYKVYKTKADLKVGKTWVSIGKNLWLCPTFPVKYMNHSCDANLGFKSPQKLFARRNINKDEELTIDYSTVEFVEFWSMPCHCGSLKCRRTMRSIQFLPRNVYNGYLPYIPRFFRDIYLKYHRRKNATHGQK